MSILDIRNLNIKYITDEGKVHAVKDLNFTVDENDAVGIVGESGSGKSTMAMTLLQLIPNHMVEITGEIYYNGIDLLKLSNDELNQIRWKEIAFVFQKSMSALSPVHRIGDQLTDIYLVHNPNESKEASKNHIIGILEKVNLPARTFDSYPHELSGGMMQRVSIALSLINNPKIIIFDEATTALDVVVQEQVLDVIMDLEEDFNLTRLMITHDISVVASTCNKVIVMKDGVIREMGLVDEVLVNPKDEYTKKLLESYINIV